MSRYWMATLVGGIHDGERVAIDCPYPRLNTWPTLECPEARYRRIHIDHDKYTAAYLSTDSVSEEQDNG